MNDWKMIGKSEKLHESRGETVKMPWWSAVGEIIVATEEFHTQKGKDDDENDDENQQ